MGDEANETTKIEREPCACYGCTDAGRLLEGHGLTCQDPKKIPAWAIEAEKKGQITRRLLPGGYAWERR